jgi:hypothetical protein
MANYIIIIIIINNKNNNNNKELKNKCDTSILGATGTISKLFRQYLSNVLGKHEIKLLQKNGHTGYSTHTSECTDIKVQKI